MPPFYTQFGCRPSAATAPGRCLPRFCGPYILSLGDGVPRHEVTGSERTVVSDHQRVREWR